MTLLTAPKSYVYFNILVLFPLVLGYHYASIILIYMRNAVSHCNSLRKYMSLLNVMSYYQAVVAKQPRLRFAPQVFLSDTGL